MHTKKIKKNSGQVAVIVTLFALLASVAITVAVSSPVVDQLKSNRELIKSKKSFYTAESATEDIIYRIKNNMNASAGDFYANGGSSAVNITDLGNGVKQIESLGSVGDRLRKLQSTLRVSAGASFHYGLFVGQGGVNLSNNTQINGSVYSNGNIIGSNNVKIAGDVYVATPVSTTTDVENTNYVSDFYFGNQDVVDVAQSFVPSSTSATLGKVALNIKKIGSPSNINIKIVADKNNFPDKNNILASSAVSSSLVGEDYSFIEVSFGNNVELRSDKKYWIVADLNGDDSNYYVWGMSDGDSDAKYSDDWTKGDFLVTPQSLNYKVWVNNPDANGTLSNVVVGDDYGDVFSAHAHSIIDSDISGDAYSQTLSGTNVGGSVYSDSISSCMVTGDAYFNTEDDCLVGGSENTPTVAPSDPSYLTNPISDANINSWKDSAISLGVISSGDYSPEDNEVLPGGVIEGDLNISFGKTVYLLGNVYVKGNVQISGDVSLKVSGLGSRVFVSDGWMYFDSNVLINSPREGNSHIMMLSLARCDENYGFEKCSNDDTSISINNNAVVDIVAAPYGSIDVNNNVQVVSLIGDMLNLKNNIVLNYEQGLTNLNFSSGPSAAWSVESWGEI